MWGWNKGDDGADEMLKCCRPLGVEIFSLTEPTILKDWQSPKTAAYRGMHGITLTDFHERTN